MIICFLCQCTAWDDLNDVINNILGDSAGGDSPVVDYPGGGSPVRDSPRDYSMDDLPAMAGLPPTSTIPTNQSDNGRKTEAKLPAEGPDYAERLEKALANVKSDLGEASALALLNRPFQPTSSDRPPPSSLWRNQDVHNLKVTRELLESHLDDLFAMRHHLVAHYRNVVQGKFLAEKTLDTVRRVKYLRARDADLLELRDDIREARLERKAKGGRLHGEDVTE